jgi:5-methylcytosine-specific restriction endonuclease McrA
MVDKGITLEKLFRRDRGQCYICGGICDWNDFSIKDNAFIAGQTYPSIDHVKPLAKGGEHSWDNVKLAHFVCNSLKSDKI